MSAAFASRLSRIAMPLAFAGVAVALVLPQQVRLAENKPFWGDEGHEWHINCAQSVTDLVVHGALEQCSPSPGYYLAQKLVARVISIDDERILVTYRAISLAASAVLILSLSGGLAARLGLPAALAALASLFGQSSFHVYSTESRPYALALCLFTMLVLLLAEGASSEGAPGRAWAIAVALAGPACSLVLLTGAAQTVFACASFLLLARVRPASPGRRAQVLVVAVLAVGAACALYYRWRSTCLAYDPGPYSVSGSQGPQLLSDVVRLIWTDAQWVNLLALVGCAAPVRAWLRRHSHGPTESFALALGAMVIGQLVLTVALAAQVALADYYFLPRLFLHLVVCRAMLVALGTWLLLDLLRGTRPWAVAQVVAGMLACGSLWLADRLLRQEVEDRRNAAPWHARTSEACASWPVPLPILVAGELPWERGPNLLVEAAHEARRCGWTSTTTPRYLVASPGEARAIVDVRPPGAQPLLQCGREVALSPESDR